MSIEETWQAGPWGGTDASWAVYHGDAKRTVVTDVHRQVAIAIAVAHASSLDATLTRAQTAEAALAEAKAAQEQAERLLRNVLGREPHEAELATGRRGKTGAETIADMPMIDDPAVSEAMAALTEGEQEALARIDQHPTQEAVDPLRNLLAIIHRDGGHHTDAVGVEQSVADAHQVWAELRLQAEAVDVNAIRRVIAALAKRGCTHWVSCPDLGREPYCYVCAILADPAIRPYLEQAGETA
jgi:hypothetical protein